MIHKNMTANQSFYFSDEKHHEQAKNRINRALEEGQITPDDKKIITRYLREKDSQGIGAKRHLKLTIQLILLREYLPPFLECTTDDVLDAFNALRFAKRKAIGKEKIAEKDLPRMKQNTVSDKQRILKYLFVWMAENKINPQLDLARLSKMKPMRRDYLTVNEKDLLTEKELQLFFKACRTPRDQAMFNLMFEGALRAGEIGNLQFKDLELNEKYCRITTSQKTGIPRTIPIYSSRVYLSRWLNEYPILNPSPEDFVFLNSWKRPISHAIIAKQMRVIGKRAGIQKHLHPHLFRHTRITMLSRAGLDEAKLKLFAWGNLGTDMMMTYNHLTDTDMEETFAELNGIETEKKKQKKQLKPIQCPKCGTINPPGQKYCECCMKPLTDEAVGEMEALSRMVYEKLKGNPTALFDVLR